MEVKERLVSPATIAKWAKAKTAAVVAVAMPLVASAQEAGDGAIDVGPTVAKIVAQLGPIGLIGTAILGVVVAIAAFKWIRRAAS